MKRLHCKELEVIQNKIHDSIQKKDNTIETLKNQIKVLLLTNKDNYLNKYRI